jgi:hypothetical protein
VFGGIGWVVRPSFTLCKHTPDPHNRGDPSNEFVYERRSHLATRIVRIMVCSEVSAYMKVDWCLLTSDISGHLPVITVVAERLIGNTRNSGLSFQ